MKNKRIWGLAAALIAVLIVIRPDGAKDVLVYTGKGTVQFLWNLIPVFLCVGLMDVWVEKEKMMQIMGTDSGLRGMAISLLIGIVTAVPIYALLPIAGMLLKKGGRISNVLIFLCSSASVRIPLLLFEISSLGVAFSLCRFLMNLLAVFAIAALVERALTQTEREEMYRRNQS